MTMAKRKAPANLPLTLAIMRLFDIDGQLAAQWIAAAQPTVDEVLRRMLASGGDPSKHGPNNPFGTITDAADNANKEARTLIKSRIDEADTNDRFHIKAAVDTWGHSVAEDAALYGVLVGWRLRDEMGQRRGGVDR